jgi:hypothetical protein
MLPEISRCAACDHMPCGLLEVGRTLRQEPEILIHAEAFSPDAKIPVTGGCLLTVNVRADPNLSHRADPILSQGWKPTLRGSAVDKCRGCAGSAISLLLC